ncbi:hypothetical protein [Photobacterium damselae]
MSTTLRLLSFLSFIIFDITLKINIVGLHNNTPFIEKKIKMTTSQSRQDSQLHQARNIMFGLETAAALTGTYFIAATTHSSLGFLYLATAPLHCILLASIISNRGFKSLKAVGLAVIAYILSLVATRINGTVSYGAFSIIGDFVIEWVAIFPMPYYLYAAIIRLQGVKYVEADND